MQAFKAKIKETKQSESEESPLVVFPDCPRSGSVRIQAVYYSSKNPSQHLRLYDGDGDMCLFPIPGQESEKVIPLDSPITVRLPLFYLDEDNNGNEAIVFGELIDGVQ